MRPLLADLAAVSAAGAVAAGLLTLILRWVWRRGKDVEEP